MIKAIIRDGRIEPLAALPEEWADGRELVIDSAHVVESDDWVKEVAESMADIQLADHRMVLEVVNQHRGEAKEQMRREMEQN